MLSCSRLNHFYMLLMTAMVAGALFARGELNLTVEKGIVQLPPHSLMIVQGKQADLKKKALNLGTLQPDLVTPQVTEGAPAPGRHYLGREHPGGTFTFLELPFPDHTDTWVLRDVPERKLLREWFQSVLGAGR
jgi:hypothetical protein